MVGCSGEEDLTERADLRQDAIVLDVKEVVAPVTRAQHTGDMDFTQLKSTGFGVYGYQGTYNAASSAPTLLAANTPVTFHEGGTDPTTMLTIPGSWEYAATTEGLKVWESGTKYTFFAYAPYMSAGEAAPGITSVSTGNGDPTIGYTIATNPAQSVDLLWGVRTDTQANSGKPWIDITKGSTASAVLFTFYHALCALGVQAQVMVNQDNNLADLDDASHLGTGVIGSKDGCKVTLKSITITPKTAEDAASSFYQSGVLNLNNTTAHQPAWTSKTGSVSSLTLDVDNIKPALLDPTPNDNSSHDVMTHADYDDERPGITETANGQKVISGDNVFMLIPQEAQKYEIAIEYFLTYKTGDGTYHREALTGTATLTDLELKAGVKYYLKLVFGLTSFKVTVNAVDWVDETKSTTIATENGTSASNSL